MKLQDLGHLSTKEDVLDLGLLITREDVLDLGHQTTRKDLPEPGLLNMKKDLLDLIATKEKLLEAIGWKTERFAQTVIS